MDNEKLAALVTAYTEAQAQTMVAWSKVEKIKPDLVVAEADASAHQIDWALA